jgi:hypothetical protein
VRIYPDDASRHFAFVRKSFESSSYLGERRTQSIEEGLAGSRRRDTSRCAIQKLCAKTILQ